MNKTKYNVVIMGKNTYFSLPVRPLQNRLNIVLTSTPEKYDNKQVIFTDDHTIYKSIITHRENYKQMYPYLSNDFIIFIIGGKSIYEQFIPLCNKVWVTRIKKEYECDLCLDYDVTEFTETLLEEDDELIMYEYNRK